MQHHQIRFARASGLRLAQLNPVLAVGEPVFERDKPH